MSADSTARSLRRYDLDALDAHTGAIYALTADLRLAYFNAQWFRFAADNGGEPKISVEWPVGRSVLDCIPDPFRPGFEGAYRRCMQTRIPWVHEYECSSPTCERHYHQIAYALEADGGLLIVNSPIVKRVVEHPLHGGLWSSDPDYADDDGLLHQCMHCRRFRRRGESEQWDWIPDWAQDFPRPTSHGLCATCFFFHYPVRR